LNIAKTHFYVANIFLDVAKRPIENVSINRLGTSKSGKKKSRSSMLFGASCYVGGRVHACCFPLLYIHRFNISFSNQFNNFIKLIEMVCSQISMEMLKLVYCFVGKKLNYMLDLILFR
jgi:hypothetical protein